MELMAVSQLLRILLRRLLHHHNGRTDRRGRAGGGGSGKQHAAGQNSRETNKKHWLTNGGALAGYYVYIKNERQRASERTKRTTKPH